MNLLKNSKITKVKAYQAGATSAVDSDEVDMSGWDGVLFLASIGTPATNNSMKAQQDTATGMSTAADLEGTSVASTSAKTDLALDIYRPRERFVRVEITRTTSTTVEAIWAIQYRGRKGAQTNITTLQAAESHVSPAEGTA